MNLKDLITGKDAQPELYWALVIENGLVQSGIWYIKDDKSEVIGIGAGVPWKSEDELVEATDATLSSAIQKLPEDYPEPQKTVFCVSTSWVKDGEISEENLTKIKKLCTELSLTPMGFVVLPEAIAHLYESEEGAPLNAIVLKCGDESIEISVFKLGKLVGTTEVSRSVSLVDDVVEGLSRFEGITPLPTRFIVYDGKEGALDENRQTLIQADWSLRKIEFLHTPQVETLAIDRKVLATALAGGAEMGNVKTVIEVNDEEESEEVISEETNNETIEKIETLSPEAVGFSVGEDVSSLVKEDVQNFVPVGVSPHSTVNQSQPQLAKTKHDYFAKSKNLFHSLSRLLPKREGKISIKSKFIYLILIILVFGAIAVLVLWWFVQTAKVTIYVTPKRSEENIQMTFSTNNQLSDISETIPAEALTANISGEKTKPTTGTKLVGDKASGTVQIANGNSAAINLSAGTVITSSGGYKFVLSSEASVSGQILPGSPGTATVNVSAYDIGAEYNLAKGEVFGVGNYSKALVAATSTEDFTGGSSQEISAVSKEDQTGLEKDLIDELKINARSEIASKVTDDKYFIDDLAELNIINENFDHKVSEEASTLKLSLEVGVVGLVADRNTLLEYARNLLQDKAPDGYSLSNDQIDYKFTYVNKEDDKYKYDSIVGGNFLPEIDKEQIKKVVQGKTSGAATNYLNSIPGFDHADVSLKIKFPEFLKTIPRITKNITVDIKPQ